jgi:hypothetical protein
VPGLKIVGLRFIQQSDDMRNLTEAQQMTDIISEYQDEWGSHVRRILDYRVTEEFSTRDHEESGIWKTTNSMII